MHLGEELLYTTARIEVQIQGGSSVGTGFFFAHNEQFFLVTNKHVIENMISGKFTVLNSELNKEKRIPKLGELIEYEFEDSDFKGHPDENIDIAVANITTMLNESTASGIRPFLKFARENDIPNQEFIDNYIRPIEEVVFIGYPSRIWDAVNGLPIIRKGITATAYYVDFEGEKKFLIDASVFNGSSGSPVFLYYSGSYSDKRGELYSGDMFKLLGIISSSYYRNEEGTIIVKNIPTRDAEIPVTKQMIDLGVVFNSTMVLETINYYLGNNN